MGSDGGARDRFPHCGRYSSDTTPPEAMGCSTSNPSVIVSISKPVKQPFIEKYASQYVGADVCATGYTQVQPRGAEPMPLQARQTLGATFQRNCNRLTAWTDRKCKPKKCSWAWHAKSASFAPQTLTRSWSHMQHGIMMQVYCMCPLLPNTSMQLALSSATGETHEHVHYCDVICNLTTA